MSNEISNLENEEPSTAEYEEATARAKHDEEQEQYKRNRQTGYEIYTGD